MRHVAKKALLYVAMACSFWAGYQYIAAATAERSGGTSFLTPIDELIPFSAWFVFPYMSLYMLYWLPVIASKNISLRDFAVIAGGTALAFGIAFGVYAAIPSNYPRPSVDPDASPAHYVLAKMLYALDLPNNTLPSTHAAVVAVLLVGTWKKFGRRTYAVYALWGVSILASTVTIKQHYIADIADIAAGVTVGLLAFFFARRVSRLFTT